MLKKTIVSVTAIVVIAGITLFAAEKAKEKKAAEKAEQQAEAVQQPALPALECRNRGSKLEGPKQREDLLDQLIKAYKEDDKKAMGEIIQKMEQRRDKARQLRKLEKWHQWSHRRMGMGQAGPGWQRGEGRMGPGWGMDGRGPVGGGCGCCCGGMGNRQAPAGGFRPQPPCGEPVRRPCGGFGPGQGWAPGPGQRRPEPPGWDMPPVAPRERFMPPEQDWWLKK